MEARLIALTMRDAHNATSLGCPSIWSSACPFLSGAHVVRTIRQASLQPCELRRYESSHTKALASASKWKEDLFYSERSGVPQMPRRSEAFTDPPSYQKALASNCCGPRTTRNRLPVESQTLMREFAPATLSPRPLPAHAALRVLSRTWQ